MNILKTIVYQTERMSLADAFEYLERFDAGRFNNYTLIVMPEKWIKDIIVRDSPEYEKLVSILESVSRESSCAIVPGSFSLKEDGAVYNASPMFSSGKLLGWQKKISLFKVEKETYSPGGMIKLFEVFGYKLGIAVCYDIDFPYYAKKLVSEGCDLIVNPSLIHSGFTDMWHLYIRSRALENRIPVISVNSISEPFSGNSIAVEPYNFDFGARIKDYECKDAERCVFQIDPDQSNKLRIDRIKEDPGSYDLDFRSKIPFGGL